MCKEELRLKKGINSKSSLKIIACNTDYNNINFILLIFLFIWLSVCDRKKIKKSEKSVKSS